MMLSPEESETFQDLRARMLIEKQENLIPQAQDAKEKTNKLLAELIQFNYNAGLNSYLKEDEFASFENLN
jgi:hypothetical protein